jgi:hypothetical protein
MEVPNGAPPSLTCYSLLDSVDTEKTKLSETNIEYYTLYSDYACTNKIGTYFVTYEKFNKFNSENKQMTSYSGTYLFDGLGNISFLATDYETNFPHFLDEIIYGTDDFLNTKGYKYTIFSPDSVSIHYIYIAV